MTRIIVHAGFHKTGTTSLQDFFNQNKETLEPWLHYYGKADFIQAGANARKFGQRPLPHRLFMFRRSFRRFLASIPDAPQIILSRETFSGIMPGHRGLFGKSAGEYYPSAHRLARVIIAELHRRFGQSAEITFFYTTRQREEWIKSVHGHLLRSIKLTQSLEEFRAQHCDLPSPEQQVQKMTDFLAPLEVVSSPLEQWANHKFGPATALLELAQVPKLLYPKLRAASRSNQGQPREVREEFLELNRQPLSKRRLRRIKETLLAHRER